MRRIVVSWSTNQIVALGFSIAILLLLVPRQILGERPAAVNEAQNDVAAIASGDVVAYVFAKTNPATAVVVVQNRGVSVRNELRCIVRLEPGLRRVARGDSLLLKPTSQFNKYKFVVRDLAAGVTRRFEFPVLIVEAGEKANGFSIQLGTDLRSVGIGITTNVNELPAVDNDWGTLRGRFVYDGEIPALRRIRNNQHTMVFGRHVFDESLVVDPKTNGISNVVVKLFVPKGGNVPKVHAGFSDPPPAVLQIANGQFVPRVSLLRLNQVLTVINRDEINYNPRVDSLWNRPMNPILGSGQLFECKFENAERLPVSISGAFHPWLMGKLVVSDHPYVAKTDRNGNFEIRNIPPGHHEFQVWHERCGYLTEALVGGELKPWPKGVFQRDIKKGDNDVGEIVVSSDRFK